MGPAGSPSPAVQVPALAALLPSCIMLSLLCHYDIIRITKIATEENSADYLTKILKIFIYPGTHHRSAGTLTSTDPAPPKTLRHRSDLLYSRTTRGPAGRLRS